MHALVAFSHVLAGHFTTSEVYPRVLQALGFIADQYKLNSLRYDLSKLRAKALVEKIPRSRRYRLTAERIPHQPHLPETVSQALRTINGWHDPPLCR
jgi:hypothetical protein